MTERLAALYLTAVQRNDAGALRELHRPDAGIWHNTDDITTTVDETAATLRWMHRVVPDLEFVDVRVQFTERGWVQQHVMMGTKPDGSAMRACCCVVVTVASGLIAHVDEYLDSSAVMGLT